MNKVDLTIQEFIALYLGLPFEKLSEGIKKVFLIKPDTLTAFACVDKFRSLIKEDRPDLAEKILKVARSFKGKGGTIDDHMEEFVERVEIEFNTKIIPVKIMTIFDNQEIECENEI